MQVSLCATIGGNVGAPACDVQMGALRTILVTRGKEFTASELADTNSLRAAIAAAMLLGNDNNNKIYAFPVFRNVTDNTGDPNVETLPDGSKQTTSRPVPSYTLESTIGYCQARNVARFNGFSGKVYVIDGNQRFFFLRKTGGGGKGFSIGNIDSDSARWGGFTGARTIKHRLSFGSEVEFRSEIGAMNADFDVTSMVNIQNVALRLVTSTTGPGEFSIAGQIECTNQEIYPAYRTLLKNTAAWKVVNADTGAAVPVTFVGNLDTIGAWNVTAADIPAGKYYFSLAAPDALLALGVEGLESFPLLVTVV